MGALDPALGNHRIVFFAFSFGDASNIESIQLAINFVYQICKNRKSFHFPHH